MKKLDRNFTFIHVPKAGGTSVSELLFEIMEPVYPREKLLDYPLFHEIEKPEEQSLFISHFGYNFFRGAGGYSMTILRDPVERVLSLYSYWKNPDGKSPPGDPLPEGMSLAEFLASDRDDIWANIRDAQTWQLAFSLDADTRRRLPGLRSFELLDIAKANIDRIDVVGVIEKPEQIISQLQALFPEKHGLTLERYNRTAERVAIEDADPADIKTIREMTFTDALLYKYAAQVASRRASG
jgi:hypothetical protein